MFNLIYRPRNHRFQTNQYGKIQTYVPPSKGGYPNNRTLKWMIVAILLFACSSIFYITFYIEFTPEGMKTIGSNNNEVYFGIYQERVLQYKTKPLKTRMAIKYVQLSTVAVDSSLTTLSGIVLVRFLHLILFCDLLNSFFFRYLVEDIEDTLKQQRINYNEYKRMIGYDPFDRSEFFQYRREVNQATIYLHNKLFN